MSLAATARWAALAFTLSLMAGQAQAAPTTPDAALRTRLAREYFEANGGAAAMRARLQQVFAAMQAPIEQSVPQSTKPILTPLVAEMSAELQREAPQFIDLAAGVYAEKLSVEELQALVAWTKSPVGMSIRAKMPEIQKELMSRETPMMTAFMTGMMKKVVDQTCDQTSCTPEQREQLEAAMTKVVPQS